MVRSSMLIGESKIDDGPYTFRVRAYDGAGTLQPTRERGPHPDGATRLHAMTLTL